MYVILTKSLPNPYLPCSFEVAQFPVYSKAGPDAVIGVSASKARSSLIFVVDLAFLTLLRGMLPELS